MLSNREGAHDNKGGAHQRANRLVAFTLAWLLPFSIAAAQTPSSPKPDLPARISDTERLRSGWYSVDPYPYRDCSRGIPVLTGFDAEIERVRTRMTHVQVLLPEIAEVGDLDERVT